MYGVNNHRRLSVVYLTLYCLRLYLFYLLDSNVSVTSQRFIIKICTWVVIRMPLHNKIILYKLTLVSEQCIMPLVDNKS